MHTMFVRYIKIVLSKHIHCALLCSICASLHVRISMDRQIDWLHESIAPITRVYNDISRFSREWRPTPAHPKPHGRRVFIAVPFSAALTSEASIADSILATAPSRWHHWPTRESQDNYRCGAMGWIGCTYIIHLHFVSYVYRT